MSYIASFDIGTTNTKGVLVSKEAELLFEKNVAMTTLQENGRVEQDPQQWFEAIVEISTYWFSQGIEPEEIVLITLSGQMQDCIPINDLGVPVRPAILYSDGRASKQSADIIQTLGSETIRNITGNHLDGTLTFPKILWLKEEEPELFERTESILISSKDYVIRQLTGWAVTDPTSASTTGLMNMEQRQWQKDWLAKYDIPESKLPTICQSDQVAGRVTSEASARTGLATGIPVLCGIGDAGAATIGAGVTQMGEVYAHIGTTGWMAMLTDQVGFISDRVFHLSYVDTDHYIVAPPMMNAGSVHRWAASVFSDVPTEEATYHELEKQMKSYDRENSQLLFLPYLNGERYPVQDHGASGVYIGIRPTSTKAELGSAALEGVAMAMKQVMEQIVSHKAIRRLTLIGGGSKSGVWNQIFADVLGMEVQIPHEPQYIPSQGAAALGFVHLGWCQNISDFFRLAPQSVTTYRPDKQLREHLERKYARYLMIYPACKEIFANEIGS